MDGMEDKLGSILGNPEMMQKIMAMAQALNTQQKEQDAPPKPPEAPAMPPIDMSMLQKLSGLMGQTNIDTDQRALLSALLPYLSRERVRKLENAMRAAKMAGFAAAALQQGNLMNSGR